MIDRYSARVLRVSDSRNLTREASVWKWRTALHFGHWGGLTTQILYVGLGLLPSFLFVTGILMWRNKVYGRMRRAKGQKNRLNKTDGVETNLMAQ